MSQLYFKPLADEQKGIVNDSAGERALSTARNSKIKYQLEEGVVILTKQIQSKKSWLALGNTTGSIGKAASHCSSSFCTPTSPITMISREQLFSTAKA